VRAVQEYAASKGRRGLWLEKLEFERAIADDELHLEYEPILGLSRRYAAKRIETRALWAHPRLGTLTDAQFGPQAARAGLATTVTEWVVTTALRQTRAWRRLGQDVGIAVNVSAADLDPRLANTLAAVLEFSGSVPAAVTCEVSGDVIARRPDLAAQVFSDLRSLGVRVAIDVSSESASRAVTAIAAARELAIGVVACGIDGDHVLETARALGCDAAQGRAVSPRLDAGRGVRVASLVRCRLRRTPRLTGATPSRILLVGAPPSCDSGLLARGDRFDPRGCRPRRGAARGPAGHAGIPRPRARRLPLPDLPDASSAAVRAERKAGDGPAARDEPGDGRHGALALRVAPTSSTDAAALGLRFHPAHLTRALERAASSRPSPRLDPPPSRS
jgi:EAL domain-containing protein (putative c-di-GMP-specific phosphodiesterase class I)